MAARVWPDLDGKHRWALGLMDELLERTTQTPDALAARAAELRTQAERTDIDGHRVAALVLADRYELAAERRRAS